MTVVFASVFCFVGWQYFFKEKESVQYLVYDKKRDEKDIDLLLEKNIFWLVHGDGREGIKSLKKTFASGKNKDDFDPSVEVPYFIKVARLGDKTIGFASYFGSDEKKIGRLHILCVDQEYRRLGIGKKLVEDILAFFKDRHYEKVFLYTRPENIRGKALYKKLGFYEVDQENTLERLYEKDPGDVLVCQLV